MAELRIKETFFFSSRKSFVLIGSIIDGNIEPGMTLTSDVNNITLKIDSIEQVDSKKGRDLIGLVFTYNDNADIEVLNNLKPEDCVSINE